VDIIYASSGKEYVLMIEKELKKAKNPEELPGFEKFKLYKD
jgi:hypothetical protein